MRKLRSIKILIADDEQQTSRRLAGFLSEHGFECQTVTNGVDAKRVCLDWQPRFILADLMLPEKNAFKLLHELKNEPKLKAHKLDFIVTSGHNVEKNVREAFKHGASDYIVKPFRFEDVLNRIVFHFREHRNLQPPEETPSHRQDDEATLMLHLTDLILRQALDISSVEETLFKLTNMVNVKLGGVRCSVVEFVDQTTGYVVTSNDDRSASGIELDLGKYPEIVNVVNTNQVIAIENIEESYQLKRIRHLLTGVGFNSMIVCPIQRHGRIFGVLSVRMPLQKKVLLDNEIRFVEIASHVVSLVLNGQGFTQAGQFWHRSA